MLQNCSCFAHEPVSRWLTARISWLFCYSGYSVLEKRHRTTLNKAQNEVKVQSPGESLHTASDRLLSKVCGHRARENGLRLKGGRDCSQTEGKSLSLQGGEVLHALHSELVKAA